MDTKIYLYFITYLITASPSVASLCSIRDDGQCFYTVICNNPRLIPTEPACKDSNIFVTLTINNSTALNITANYYTSHYDPWVRIFNAIGFSWTFVHSYAFHNFKNVLYIDISQNKIKSIGSAFKGLKQLDSLNLSRNRLEVIDPDSFIISNYNNRLYLLDLSYNLLSYLPERLFQYLLRLKKLYLQGNQMIVLQEEYSRYFKKLSYLNLCCNNMRLFNATLKHSVWLKELNLSFNELKQVNISPLLFLETINLSHNKIEEFVFDTFEKSPCLTKVDFSFNHLTKLFRITNKKVYSYVNAHLMHLDFDNNKISYIDSNFFLTFKYISYLNLSYNEITEFNPGTFKDVKVLRTLNVSNCKLKLNDETFKGLDHTEIIDVSKNNITTFDAMFFNECTALKRIFADDNQIYSYNIDKFKKILPKLTRITLTGNPHDVASLIGNGVLGTVMNIVMELANIFFLIIMNIGIIFMLIYVGIHRRIIFVYILKCTRCLLIRQKCL